MHRSIVRNTELLFFLTDVSWQDFVRTGTAAFSTPVRNVAVYG